MSATIDPTAERAPDGGPALVWTSEGNIFDRTDEVLQGPDGARLAVVAFWTKDGAFHVALPDPARGPDLYWIEESFSSMEAGREYARAAVERSRAGEGS